MKIKILRTATNDLEAGRTFYDRQGVGIGDYFLDSLFADIDSLALYGGIHSIHHGFYRLLSKRFPYAVYYKILNETVVVFRVLDCRRDPKRIGRSLEGS